METALIDEGQKKLIRLKVIRPIYETLIAEGDEVDMKEPIMSSKKVYEMFRFLTAETREHFIALHLNTKNQILAIDRVSIGSLSANVVHPRDVLKSCLLSSAAAIVCIHNHPSGNPEPSKEDYKMTDQLNKAAGMMGIRFLDHVIIGDGSYVSFADRGDIDEVNRLTSIIHA